MGTLERRIKNRHDPALIDRVCSMYRTYSAEEVAKLCGLASAAVVYSIWNYRGMHGKVQGAAEKSHGHFHKVQKKDPALRLKGAEELEPLGPRGEFPEAGLCVFTTDEVVSNEQWRMCGRPGYPWCEYHHKRVYNNGAGGGGSKDYRNGHKRYVFG